VIREEYLRRLIDAAHVELYLSGADGARIYWPWRMEPPKEASMSYRNACEVYVIDSDPQDDSVTNVDALDAAFRYDAEVCSLQDVYQDKAGTVDALLEGLEIADSHPFDGTLLLPLQQPYVECWREIGEPDGCWVGLGGLKDSSVHQRLESAKKFRDYVGDGPHVHGFGWGPVSGGDDPMALAREIRRRPQLLDSLDYSTPMQRAIGQLMTPGEERMTVQASYASFRLIRDLREVTPYPETDDTDTTQLSVVEF
jgi:hypothetical protein